MIVAVESPVVRVSSVKGWSACPRTWEFSRTFGSAICSAALSRSGLHLAVATETQLFVWNPLEEPGTASLVELGSPIQELRFSCVNVLSSPSRKQSVSDEVKQELQAATPFLAGLAASRLRVFSLDGKPEELDLCRIEGVLAYCFQDRNKNTLYFMKNKAVCKLMVASRPSSQYTEQWRPAGLDRLEPVVALASGGDNLFVGGFYDGKKTMVLVFCAEAKSGVQRITLELRTTPRTLTLQFERAPRRSLLITTSRPSTVQLLQADDK